MTTDQSSVIKSSARLRNGVVWGVSDVVWLIAAVALLGMGYSCLKSIVNGFLNSIFLETFIENSLLIVALSRLPRVGFYPSREHRFFESYHVPGSSLFSQIFFNWFSETHLESPSVLFMYHFLPFFLVTIVAFLVYDVIRTRHARGSSTLLLLFRHRYAARVSLLVFAVLYNISCAACALAWIVFDYDWFYIGSVPVTQFGLNSPIGVYTHVVAAALLFCLGLRWYSEVLRRIYKTPISPTANCAVCGYSLGAIGGVCPECGPNPKTYRKPLSTALWKPTLVCGSVVAFLLCSPIWLSWIA